MCLLLLPKLFGEGMRPQATRIRPSATSVCGLKLLTDAAVANKKKPDFFFEDVARILVAGLAAITVLLAFSNCVLIFFFEDVARILRELVLQRFTVLLAFISTGFPCPLVPY